MKLLSTIFSLSAVVLTSCGVENNSSEVRDFDVGKIYPIGQEPERDLDITFSDLDVSKGGSVCISIVDRHASFPEIKNEEAAFVECKEVEDAHESGIKATLKIGRYAAAVFHDTNENGKLDTKKILFIKGIPAEPFGFSTNPSEMSLRNQKDLFNRVAFNITEEDENKINIEMKKM